MLDNNNPTYTSRETSAFEIQIRMLPNSGKYHYAGHFWGQCFANNMVNKKSADGVRLSIFGKFEPFSAVNEEHYIELKLAK